MIEEKDIKGNKTWVLMKLFKYLGNDKRVTLKQYMKSKLEKEVKEEDLKEIAEKADELIQVIKEIKEKWESTSN